MAQNAPRVDKRQYYYLTFGMRVQGWAAFAALGARVIVPKDISDILWAIGGRVDLQHCLCKRVPAGGVQVLPRDEPAQEGNSSTFRLRPVRRASRWCGITWHMLIDQGINLLWSGLRRVYISVFTSLGSLQCCPPTSQQQHTIVMGRSGWVSTVASSSGNSSHQSTDAPSAFRQPISPWAVQMYAKL